jgi:hypothetical protein
LVIVWFCVSADLEDIDGEMLPPSYMDDLRNTIDRGHGRGLQKGRFMAVLDAYTTKVQLRLPTNDRDMLQGSVYIQELAYVDNLVS